MGDGVRRPCWLSKSRLRRALFHSPSSTSCNRRSMPKPASWALRNSHGAAFRARQRCPMVKPSEYPASSISRLASACFCSRLPRSNLGQFMKCLGTGMLGGPRSGDVHPKPPRADAIAGGLSIQRAIARLTIGSCQGPGFRTLKARRKLPPSISAKNTSSPRLRT